MRILKYTFFLLCIISLVYLIEIKNVHIKMNEIIKKKTIEKTILKENSKFKQSYVESKQKLYKQISLVKKCVKEKLKSKCNYKAEDLITMLPNQMTKPTEIYHVYRGGYSSIIEPKFENDKIEIIVGIPCGPPQLIGRIAVRETYMKEKLIDGFNAKYMFLTGLPPEPYYSYSLDYLNEESFIYNDMLVFDFINTYHNITLLMMSTYKWLIEKRPNIKYFIRSNLDVLFFPKRIKGLLNESKYDIISEFSQYKKTDVYYPQGAFYIFSMKAVFFIYNHSFYQRPIHRWDDLYYGEIITSYKNRLKLYNMGGKNKQMKWDCSLCNRVYEKNNIALHPFFPAAIIIFYNTST